jgi:hypothetical protein
MPIEGGVPRIRVIAEGGGADGSGLSDRPLDRVRYAVCAIGYIKVSAEEHQRDPSASFGRSACLATVSESCLYMQAQKHSEFKRQSAL